MSNIPHITNACIATYRYFDEKADFHKKAQSIAIGLTVGSWTELPEAQKKQMEKHLGQVISVQVHEPEILHNHNDYNTATGSCMESLAAQRYADIQIAYPDLNYSPDIPALLVTVFGKLSMDGRIRLIDLHFSERFMTHFPGPKFGITGVRDLLRVHDRPLLMSIFKSVIGYDLNELQSQFYAQAMGGVDLIKDDEILFENPLTPIERRVEACIQAATKSATHTQQKLLYAVNLTGPTHKLVSQAKKAIDAGANALLFNVLAYGFDMLHELSTHSEISVPIAAHPALAGAIYPSSHYGISASVLLGKLMRIAGADLVLFPSPYGSVTMPIAENLAIQQALVTDQIASHLLSSMSVPSAGIHPGLVPWIIRDFGQDVVVNAGGGIHGHPMGTIAGGIAFRQAIDAVCQKKNLEEYALSHKELQAAISTWGVKS